MVKEPVGKLQRNVHNLTTTIGQILGMHQGIQLEHDPATEEWSCTRAEPVVWFDRDFLNIMRMDRPALSTPCWTVKADTVRLECDNGAWVWELTGRQMTVHSELREQLSTSCEGRWPD